MCIYNLLLFNISCHVLQRSKQQKMIFALYHVQEGTENMNVGLIVLTRGIRMEGVLMVDVVVKNNRNRSTIRGCWIIFFSIRFMYAFLWIKLILLYCCFYNFSYSSLRLCLWIKLVLSFFDVEAKKMTFTELLKLNIKCYLRKYFTNSYISFN